MPYAYMPFAYAPQAGGIGEVEAPVLRQLRLRPEATQSRLQVDRLQLFVSLFTVEGRPLIGNL
jgi:hypothetical protein